MVQNPTPDMGRYYLLYFRNSNKLPAHLWAEHGYVLFASDSFKWAVGLKIDYVVRWCESHNINVQAQHARVRNIAQAYPHKQRPRGRPPKTTTKKEAGCEKS